MEFVLSLDSIMSAYHGQWTREKICSSRKVSPMGRPSEVVSETKIGGQLPHSQLPSYP